MLKRYVVVATCLASGMCLTVGLLRSQANRSEAPVTASRGFVVSYEKAATLESPLRYTRNALWDGQSNEAALSAESPRRKLAYRSSRAFADVLLPGGASTLCVLGRVESGRSYLSNDKSTIYTEMSLVLEKVLQTTLDTQPAVGSTLTVVRPGGIVRLSSGQRLMRGCKQESIPRPNNRYVLILDYLPPAQEFIAVNAFELSGGHVYMLDSVRSITATNSAGRLITTSGLQDFGLSEDDFVQQVSTAPIGAVR